MALAKQRGASSSKISHDIASLLAQGSDNRQEAFDEPTPRLALCPKGLAPPEYRIDRWNLRRLKVPSVT